MTSASAPEIARTIVASVVTVIEDGSGIEECLRSVHAQTGVDGDLEVVLVDTRTSAEGSSLPSAGPRDGPSVRLVRVPGASVAEARNVGLHAARADYLLLLEEHAALSPEALAILLREASATRVPVLRDSGGAGSLARALCTVGGKLFPAHVARTGYVGADELSFCLRLSDTSLVDFVLVGPRGAHAARPAENGDELTRALDTIERANRIPLGRSESRALAEAVVTAECRRINRVLRHAPDRHGEVVSQARERALDLPWSLVNKGLARDLAILYSFVPFLDTSGLVAARRLRERGLVTDVVSQDLSSRAQADPGSTLLVEEMLGEHRIVAADRDAVSWSAVRGFVEDALASVADLEEGRAPYRSLYSRAMMPAAHYAAAVLKLRRPEIRWTAEFSDPLLKNPYGETRVADVGRDWLTAELTAGFVAAGMTPPQDSRLFGWAELVAYAFADEIVFTNEQQREFMLGYCPDRTLAARAATISRAIHHPVPGRELYHRRKSGYPLPPEHLNIGYFGNFYATRDLAQITDAIDGLTLSERDQLRLHVFTAKPEQLRLKMVESGFADVVRVGPMLGYLEYLNLTTRFDVLLINDYATRDHYPINPYLPAKYADYRGSGSRIWSLYEPGSVLSREDVDYATRLDDRVGTLETLRKILALRPSAAPQA